LGVCGGSHQEAAVCAAAAAADIAAEEGEQEETKLTSGAGWSLGQQSSWPSSLFLQFLIPDCGWKCCSCCCCCCCCCLVHARNNLVKCSQGAMEQRKRRTLLAWRLCTLFLGSPLGRSIGLIGAVV